MVGSAALSQHYMQNAILFCMSVRLAVHIWLSLQFYVSVGVCHGLPGGAEHMGAFQETRVSGVQLHLGDGETV